MSAMVLQLRYYSTCYYLYCTNTYQEYYLLLSHVRVIVFRV